MKQFSTLLLVAFYLSFSSNSFAQTNYWQQQVDYDIKVELQPQTHMLQADISLVYTNNSPDKLDFIWFHIWPNAYRDRNTALFKQLLKSESRKGKMDGITEMGFIDQLNWKVNGQPATATSHEIYVDIVKLMLPEPLAPGAKVTISTPFRVKLPQYFSRMGFHDAEHMITQWYPKPAVYDAFGWHPIPYLDMGEFYSEYGSFKVAITVPSNFVVASTGVLQDAPELESYKEIGAKNYATIKAAIAQNDTADYQKLISKMQWYKPIEGTSSKTLHYTAENVHDFAWFADTSFVINYDPLKLYTHKMVDAFTFYHKESIGKWMMSCNYVKDAVTFYTVHVGEYAYPVVNAVEGPFNVEASGMEYPMVTLITEPDGNNETLDAVITHEVGHNWFYSILGSNERSHAWMDEGMNTFFQFRYEAEKYRANSILPPVPPKIAALPVDRFEQVVYMSLTQFPNDGEIDKEVTDYKDDEQYQNCVYLKTAMWMYLLEQGMGADKFQKAIDNYFTTWQFRHPYPDDFKRIMEVVSGKNLKKIFKLLNRSASFTTRDFQ